MEELNKFPAYHRKKMSTIRVLAIKVRSMRDLETEFHEM